MSPSDLAWWSGFTGLALVLILLSSATKTGRAALEWIHIRLWNLAQTFKPLHRADIALERKHYAKVLRLTARALRRDPTDHDAVYTRVLALLNQGHVDSADCELRSSLGKLRTFAPAAVTLAKAHRDRADVPRALHWYALARHDPLFRIVYREDPDAREVRAWLESQDPQELEAAAERARAHYAQPIPTAEPAGTNHV